MQTTVEVEAPANDAMASAHTGHPLGPPETRPSMVVPSMHEATDGDPLPATAPIGDDEVGAVSGMVARLLGADACMIMLVADDAGGRLTLRAHGSVPGPRVSAGEHRTRQAETAARRAIRVGRTLLSDCSSADSAVNSFGVAPAVQHIVAAPIRAGGAIIGAISLFMFDKGRGRDAAALATAEIVAWLVGQSLHALRLERLLRSRFAQFAMHVASDGEVDRAVALAGSPGKMARILAKSFYREMVRVGCDSGQIIDAATEIISQLSGSVRRHRDRLRRGKTSQDLPGERIKSK